jgi:hypothetical protein
MQRASKVLRYQSNHVVKKMFQGISRASGKDKIDWKSFSPLIKELIPRTHEQKMDLFWRSFVPEELSDV